MSIFHRGGTGRGGNVGFVGGRVVASGAATNVVGGTLTAASWDGDASGVLTWTPLFKVAPNIVCSPASNAMVTVQLTGLGTNTAGFYVITSGATASAANFNIWIFGPTTL